MRSSRLSALGYSRPINHYLDSQRPCISNRRMYAIKDIKKRKLMQTKRFDENLTGNPYKYS